MAHVVEVEVAKLGLGHSVLERCADVARRPDAASRGPGSAAKTSSMACRTGTSRRRLPLVCSASSKSTPRLELTRSPAVDAGPDARVLGDRLHFLPNRLVHGLEQHFQSSAPRFHSAARGWARRIAGHRSFGRGDVIGSAGRALDFAGRGRDCDARARKRLAGLERGARPLVVLAPETMKDTNEAYRRTL
jgi:hypothetical protein